MRVIKKIYFAVLGSLGALVLALPSCDKMNDIQSKYAELDEKVYLGKVDSAKVYPGLGKAKLVWYMNADPKIDQTIIYWNMRKDSIVKPFNRVNPGVQMDSIVLENLQEGNILVEFRNINKKGETSLYHSATVTSWGPRFVESLRARAIDSFNYDYSNSTYALGLKPTFPGDSVLFTEVLYLNKSNIEKTIKIERGMNSVSLTDFPENGEFKFRTVFYPRQGFDTIYANYTAYKAPKPVFERGVKIAQKGSAGSKYFNFNGDLGEWTSTGDIIAYTVGEDGSLTQNVKYTSAISRTTFKEFFHYGENKFIGIQTNNNTYMYQLINGVFSIQKTPGNADILGSGFTFSKYIPAAGFFYSIADVTGEAKSWIALPNSTWSTPNGGVVGTGFTYTPFTMFNFQSLLGLDPAGNLWGVPIAISGAFGAESKIGMGWQRFTKIVGVGKKLYGMEANGDFYVFDNFNANDRFWIVN